jgi:hypothetical protein
MSKLQDFISQVKVAGMARNNRYTVELTPPLGIGNFTNPVKERILLFCDQVQVPGVNFSTIQNRTFGEFREVPYEKIYGDIQMSFFVDTDMNVKKLFDDWIGLIQNKQTRTFEYYNNYTVQMKINVEDLNDQTRYVVTAYECYPKSIGPIQLDYASKDVMKLQVNMMFKYWTSQNAQVGDNTTDFGLQNARLDNFMVPESYKNDFLKFQTDRNAALSGLKTTNLFDVTKLRIT